MKFDLIGVITNPFVLMFVSVATGLLLGKVKFGKFSLGTSGALFTGLIIGWGIYRLGSNIIANGEEATGYAAAVKMINNGIINSSFFETSLIVFVAAVGLLAAKDMDVVLKKYGKKFVVLGLLITLVGAGATYAATAILSNTNSYEVSGVYVGALTSSPGLASALETVQSKSEENAQNYENLSDREKAAILLALDESGKLTPENTPSLSSEQKETYIKNASASIGIGYAIAYPFGVIIVILAVNFFPDIFRMNLEEEKRKYKEEMAQARKLSSAKAIPDTPFDLIAFAVVCAVGYVVGCINIYMGPLGYFSLGATGGVLIMGLVLGYIGKIGSLSFRMDPSVLAVLREIGLAFFLAIVGLKYGFRAFDALFGSGLALAITSLAVGLLAILAGFFVGRYIFKLNWIMLSGAICGGMTSTPGLGAAIDAADSDDPAAGYGATYPFALLGMIMFTIILNKLPLL